MRTTFRTMSRHGLLRAITWLLAPAAAAGELRFTDITLEAGTGGPTEPGKLGGHGAMFADADGRQSLRHEPGRQASGFAAELCGGGIEEPGRRGVGVEGDDHPGIVP